MDRRGSMAVDVSRIAAIDRSRFGERRSPFGRRRPAVVIRVYSDQSSDSTVHDIHLAVGADYEINWFQMAVNHTSTVAIRQGITDSQSVRSVPLRYGARDHRQ